MITRRSAIRFCATAAAIVPALRSRSAQAQDFPNRIVKLVVPFPAGGGMDAAGRIVADKLTQIWGRQVIIENRGGGGTNPGTEIVVRAPPDGYTILINSVVLALNRHLYSSLAYNAVTDLAPITLICLFPNIMVVPNSSPARSVQEFIAYAKANRGKISYASSGVGSSGHLCGELLKSRTGIEMTHIPYRGASAGSLTDLIAGRVDLLFNTTGSLLQTVRAGQVRAIAVSSAKRFSATPELPTVAESGVPDFDVSSWYGLWAPAKTPPETVQKLNADTNAALADPQVKERFAALGIDVIGTTPQVLADKLEAEIRVWGPIIKAAGIKGEG